MKKVIITMAVVVFIQLFVIISLWEINNEKNAENAELCNKVEKLYEEKYNQRMLLNRERKRVDDETKGNRCPLCQSDSIYAPRNCIVGREVRRYLCGKCGYQWGIYAYCFEEK